LNITRSLVYNVAHNELIYVSSKINDYQLRQDCKRLIYFYSSFLRNDTDLPELTRVFFEFGRNHIAELTKKMLTEKIPS